MSLQFADFDADGYEDLITATFEGTVFIVKGTKTGWGLPEHIKDAQGRNIVLSLYYDMKANKYDNAERSPKGQSNPKDHCVSAMVMDWDEDGDFDLLLGAKEGRVYLQRNEGKKGAPKFTGVNELLAAGGQEFNVPGGLTAAREVDWDGDGRKDLICGSFKGGAYFYRNAGKPGAPSYAAPITLAQVDPAVGPTTGWYLDVLDHDQDGDLDLLVGGYRTTKPEAPVLTAEDKIELAKLEVDLAAIDEQIQTYLEAAMKKVEALEGDARDVAMQKAYKDPEFTAMNEKSQPLRKRIAKFKPRPQRVSGIWLYRALGSKVTPAGASSDR